MADRIDVSRRTTLGLIGALGASVASGAAGLVNSAKAGTFSASQGGSSWPDLALPHTSSTVADMTTKLNVAALTNDANTVLENYSTWDVNSVSVSSNSDGSLNLSTAFTEEERRQLVTGNYSKYHFPGGEDRLNELQGRWYDLVDTNYSVTVKSSGSTLHNRGVYVFLTWPNGVMGSLIWTKPSWAQPFDIEEPKLLTHQLIQYEDAWRTGDVSARLDTIESQTCSVARVTDVDASHRSRFTAQSKDALRAAWSSADAGTVLDLKRLHHVVSTYYVFAAYKLVLNVKGRTVNRETAVLLPLGPNDKFIGELSYSLQSPLV